MRALIVENGYSRGALAATRALHAAGWSVAIASPAKGLAGSSRATSSWHRLQPARRGKELFAQRLASIVEQTKTEVLFAAGDEEILALSSLRERFTAEVPYPDHGTLVKALDKLHLHEAAFEAGVSSPRTELATPAALQKVERPVIVKARAHGGLENDDVPDRWDTFRAQSRDEATRVAELIRSQGGEPILQSVVDGTLMAITTLITPQGEAVATIQQEASHTWPQPAGISVRAATVGLDQELADKVHALLRNLGWFGLAEMQFLWPAGGQPQLIDLNGRFYGSLALAIGAGVNFPDMWGRLALGQTVPEAQASVGARYQWLEGDLRRAVAERRGGLARDLVQTVAAARGAQHSMASVSDPRPVIGFSLHLLGRAVRKSWSPLSRASTAPTDDSLPGGLGESLERFRLRFGEIDRLARLRPGKPCVVLSPTHVGYIPYDRRTAREVEREANHLEWAKGQAIPCPAIEERSEEWLIVRRAPSDRSPSALYVELALEAADRIERATPPPQAKPVVRKSSRSTVVRRAFRMLMGRVRPWEFLSLRKAYEELTRDTLGHGDFHPNNVLFDDANQRVNVIDWSHLGAHPRLTDHALFWALLQDSSQRESALRAIIQRSESHNRTITVMRWIALRSLIELVTSGPRRTLPEAKVQHARTVLRESRSLQRRFGRA